MGPGSAEQRKSALHRVRDTRRFYPLPAKSGARERTAVRLRQALRSIQPERRDHGATVEIGALADDLGRIRREFEACHHAYAKRLSGRGDLTFQRSQRAEMRARKPEFDQNRVAFG